MHVFFFAETSKKQAVLLDLCPRNAFNEPEFVTKEETRSMLSDGRCLRCDFKRTLIRPLASRHKSVCRKTWPWRRWTQWSFVPPRKGTSLLLFLDVDGGVEVDASARVRIGRRTNDLQPETATSTAAHGNMHPASASYPTPVR
jgi:hypothetical protein